LNHPAIVTIAEPARHKGLGDLISAFSLLADREPNAHLYILGDGIRRSQFERQAQANPCSERIIFCGLVADPTAYLQSADIFVLASHREGFGLALAEARKSGCAIVASDVGGIPEVLDSGSAGILVPARSPERLASALLELIENPAKRRKPLPISSGFPVSEPRRKPSPSTTRLGVESPRNIENARQQDDFGLGPMRPSDELVLAALRFSGKNNQTHWII